MKYLNYLVRYVDPTHSWLRVPLKVYNEFDLVPTEYSHQNKIYIYLEEDVDAPRFIKAVEDNKLPYTIDEVEISSFQDFLSKGIV